MITKDHLEIVANITAILTFVGGVGAWGYYQYGFRQKRKALEECLKKDGARFKQMGLPGAFNFNHIIAQTGMTESEILRASFKSKRIARREQEDKEGFTKEILFRYKD